MATVDDVRRGLDDVEAHALEMERQRNHEREENGRLGDQLHEVRRIVGGGSTLLADVRVLKTRCDEAESLVTSWRARDERLRGLERDLEAAKRLAHEETARANGWKERATGAESELRTAQEAFRREVAARSETIRRERAEWAEEVRRREAAESALAERNREIDASEATLSAAYVEAASLRAQLAEARKQTTLACAAAETLTHERDSLRAQVESLQNAAARLLEVPREVAAQVLAAYAAPSGQQAGLRGGAEPVAEFYGGPAVEHYVWKAARTARMHALVAALPSPSPKTGRWKCRRCGEIITVTPEVASERSVLGGSRRLEPWHWQEGVERWEHHCAGSIQSDRIGDAPGVTP